MLSRVTSAAVQGVGGYSICVEVDLRAGLPSFSIVGLPDVGVRESRERVLAALKNSNYDILPYRITINLAPGHIKKEGPSFDFAIAIGILASSGVIPKNAIQNLGFLGELGLDGSLRPVRGVLPCALGLREMGVGGLLLPSKNIKEASIVDGIKIISIDNLSQAVQFLLGEIEIKPFAENRTSLFRSSQKYEVDFSDVKGQPMAKRALEVSAAGGHNVLLIGPPGSGKTLLARRMPTILPPLEFEEALETTKIHSVAGYLKGGESFIATRPFRSPHHGVSNSALIGGGSNPKPGEVSLAHRGVLFLDEFPEFGRHVLESLRQPLEDRFVTVARVANTVRYPSDFVLVAAANPCPCGHLGSQTHLCSCTPQAIQKYRAKISGPLMDRIDLHVEVPSLQVDEITEESKNGEASDQIRSRVMAARAIQRDRFKGKGIYENGQMNVRLIRVFCPLNGEGKTFLRQAVKRLGFTARAYDRLLQLSRTIADLDRTDNIQPRHLAEAISYRVLDRSQTVN